MNTNIKRIQLIFDRLLLTTNLHKYAAIHKDWINSRGWRFETVDRWTDGWTDDTTDDKTLSVDYLPRE